MPLVIPLEKCIARPEEGQGDVSLRHHLEAVAAACGSADGEPEKRIGFLAGLLHDAAKAQAGWQQYIHDDERTKGPPHAPFGSALFAYCADRLIASWGLDPSTRRNIQDLALDWTRVIYDHHGELRDLDEQLPPWEQTAAFANFSQLAEACDLNGIFALVDRHLSGGKFGRDDFLEWLDPFVKQWERRVRAERKKLIRHRLKGASSSELLTTRCALSIPRVATQLVVGDRYHAGNLERTYLEPEKAKVSCARLIAQCKSKARESIEEGADPRLVACRQQVQDTVLEEYLRTPQEQFYTLLLPTGYGKTLSALRVALTACTTGRCRRIVYVAPYLSILSQSTGEITKTTGIEAMQHHHLSLAEMDDDQVEVMETWQAPILTTTFNQLFRAVFPQRAQQCLRVEALRGAFVIIDEPQIIDTAVWNVFLRTFSALMMELGCQVLFTTATLPKLEWGLDHSIIPLAPEVSPLGRFQIQQNEEPVDAAAVASIATEALDNSGNVAVVMNTVRDAAEVYRLIHSEEAENSTYCLTGLMLPTHKAAVIRQIGDDLKKGKRVMAVCTQVLEAGVDLSFRAILRALPILPSVAQVAGRANRHGEGDRAAVTVFSFIREDGKDSRDWVYRDPTARTQTDFILDQRSCWPEEALREALGTYYTRCWDENRNAACLQKIGEAARGKWSELAGIEPFGSGPPRESLFVEQPIEPLNEAMQQLQARFAPEGARQLLERYQNRRFHSGLTFLERKRFSALFRQYVVPVPRKVAERVGEQLNEYLWRLIDTKDYSPHTGLAHLVVPDEEEHSLFA